MKDIGLGIIGLGMGATALRINQIADSRLEVRAVCDLNDDLLARSAQAYKIPVAVTDYRALIALPDVDVVGVYTPDHLHAEHCAAALRAGKHVVCTKPMVTSIADAEQIVALADAAGVKFLVGQTCRFVPKFAEAHRLFTRGDLGDLIFAEAHYVHDMRPVLDTTPWRYTAPQDLLYGGACHPIDLLRWFLGDVDEVSVYAAKSGMDPRYARWDLEDDFLINLKFKNGAVARVLAAFGLAEPPMPMLGLSLFGTRGSIVNEKLMADGIPGEETIGLPVVSAPGLPLESGHGGEVVAYLVHLEECILQGGAPLVDQREGARVVATCAACWESVRTGLPAKVRNEF
jgi:predicted dehydrogenase